MERYRLFLGSLGIAFLCSGAYFIVGNFTTVKYVMLEEGFLSSSRWRGGLVGVGFLIMGVLIYAWLFRGLFSLRSTKSKVVKKTTSKAFIVRKKANEQGIFLLVLLLTRS